MARSVADVETLAPSWRLWLEAENKSPATITSYTYATTRLVAFLRDKGMSNDVNAIAREHIEAFIVDVLERRSPATAQASYRAFRQFFAWCEAEGEITVTPMARMKPPRVPESSRLDVPTVEDLQKLLAACEGNDLEARRDTAIVRLFADSGLRLAELTGLRLTDVDLSAGMVGVTGKGDLFRTASFGRKTATRGRWSRGTRPRRGQSVPAMLTKRFSPGDRLSSATAASHGRSFGIVRRQAGGSRRSRLGIPVGVITSTRTKTTGPSGEPRGERPSRADEHIEAPGPLPRSRVRSAPMIPPDERHRAQTGLGTTRNHGGDH